MAIDLHKFCHMAYLALVAVIFVQRIQADTPSPSPSSPSHNCEYNIHVRGQERYTFNLQNFTRVQTRDFQQIKKINRYCKVLITTDLDRKIVFDLTYSPRMRKVKQLQSAGSETIHPVSDPPPTSTPSTSCHSDYVHVGNDEHRLDVELMTSYKFCGSQSVQHELVSRANKMWLVFKSDGSRPKQLKVNITSRKVVLCRPDEFTCSPVQCVNRDKVCDGVRDCDNGHDEYCVTTVQDLPPVPLPHTPTCFRCGEGTCISPRLPRYDINWGRGLWFLCDGYAHCPDHWDERPDICLHLLRGKVDAVIQCVPSDLQLGINQSVIMWAEHRCDDIIDCHHGEDELRCEEEDEESPFQVDSVTLGFVIGFLIAIIFVSVVVIHRLRTMAPTAAVEESTESGDDILLQTTRQEVPPTDAITDRKLCLQTTPIHDHNLPNHHHPHHRRHRHHHHRPRHIDNSRHESDLNRSSCRRHEGKNVIRSSSNTMDGSSSDDVFTIQKAHSSHVSGDYTQTK